MPQGWVKGGLEAAVPRWETPPLFQGVERGPEPEKAGKGAKRRGKGGKARKGAEPAFPGP